VAAGYPHEGAKSLVLGPSQRADAALPPKFSAIDTFAGRPIRPGTMACDAHR